MDEKRKSLSIKKIILFLIGAVSCSNILSAFVIGSTPIMLANVLAIPLLIICVYQHKWRLVNIVHCLTKDLIYLGVFIFLSIIQVLLFNPGNIYQWGVGVISFLLQFFLIMSIIESKEVINALYWGVFIGIIANFLISLYAMILYNNGVIFDLAKYFHNDIRIGSMYLSNAYRVRGFFGEQGHLMRFLAIMAIPIAQFLEKKRKTLYIFYIAAIAFMMAFTGSSSVVIFMLGFIVYIIIINGKNATKLILLMVGGTFLVIVLLYLGRNISFISKLLTAFNFGFSSIFDTTGINSGRVQGMRYALEIIKDYPVTGCGWNNLTKVFMKYGFYGVNNVMGSYSAALSLIAELGLASLFYFYFMIDKGIRLIKNRLNKTYVGYGISLFIYFVLFCLTDYTIDAGSAMFIAIILLKYTEWKDAIVEKSEIN